MSINYSITNYKEFRPHPATTPGTPTVTGGGHQGFPQCLTSCSPIDPPDELRALLVLLLLPSSSTDLFLFPDAIYADMFDNDIHIISEVMGYNNNNNSIQVQYGAHIHL